MRPALVLVDAQNDFFDRPSLAPSKEALIEALADLLARARGSRIPVIHVRTVVRADGNDRMPHWKRRDVRACIRGSAGAAAPADLTARAGEAVVEKRFFSAFGVPAMQEVLAAGGVDTLIVAGLYLHGCVRATVFDAYERGYEVLIADDAVGSTDPVHAELTRDYLADRAATFLDSDALFAAVERGAGPADRGAPRASAADRHSGSEERRFRHRNPSNLEDTLYTVPIAGAPEVGRAVAAARASRDALESLGFAGRADLLERWARGLEARADAFAASMVREIGKPITDAREEIGRALAHVRTAVRLFAEHGRERLAEDVWVRHRPQGVVAIVTPFNNPVAIPAGKIAPALLFGDAVVLKPGLETMATTALVLDALAEAGMPAGAVEVVHGDARTARHLVGHPDVNAVALTGANATGRAVYALCARAGKPLQAELGGNNAAIVLADADVGAEATILARAAFGFAGQRCTALRRFVVERSIVGSFVEALRAAIATLTVGAPELPATAVGPLVSERRRARTVAAMREAIAGGARLVCGGTVPADLAHGAWLSPVLLDVDASARAFREETFGPLAVVTAADDLEHALALANAVPHGLIAYLATADPRARRRFLAGAEAGILRIDRDAPFLHAEAPFGGWKASGIGPPEHGLWDRAFYARPQAVYGRLDGD